MEQRQVKVITNEINNVVNVVTSTNDVYHIHHFELRVAEGTDDGDIIMTLRPTRKNIRIGSSENEPEIRIKNEMDLLSNELSTNNMVSYECSTATGILPNKTILEVEETFIYGLDNK